MIKGSTGVFVIAALISITASFAFLWFQLQTVERNATGVNASQTDTTIATLITQVEAAPEQPALAAALADAYLQRIRETGDANLYSTIDELLDNALKISPSSAELLARRAAVENGRHAFMKGLATISKAIAINPRAAYMYGIKSDAELELGRYADAEASLQTMVDLKPGFSAYTRIAYQRELTGDFEGAKDALRLAISAGSANSENSAWAHAQLGKLNIMANHAEAERNFLQALAILPDYAPALDGLGRLAFAEGDSDAARTYYEKAFTVFPTAEFAKSLANLYEVQGSRDAAAQHYALADIAYLDSGGVNVDLEYSLYLSDHGKAKEALTRAKRAYSERQSIHAADALAWAEFKNENIVDARKYIEEALRLGGHDAGILFHAGSIYEAGGDAKKAREYFSSARANDQYATLVYSDALNSAKK